MNSVKMNDVLKTVLEKDGSEITFFQDNDVVVVSIQNLLKALQEVGVLPTIKEEHFRDCGYCNGTESIDRS